MNTPETSNNSTTNTPTPPTEPPSSTGPIIGLVIGLLALALSLYWMYGSGTEIQSTSETYSRPQQAVPGVLYKSYSHSESVNPLPSLIATIISFVWTASFGWMLARSVKAKKAMPR